MKLSVVLRRVGWAAACATALLAGCGGGDSSTPITIDAGSANAVSRWNEIASTTINQPNATTGTGEEINSNYAFDLATLHVAMYDAVVAIAGGYKPFTGHAHRDHERRVPGRCRDRRRLRCPEGPLPGPHGDLSADLRQHARRHPERDRQDPGRGRRRRGRGGRPASRANDGRTTALPAFVAGTAPGQFRGPAIVGRTSPFVRPFALTSAAQFRAPGPQALGSARHMRRI